MNMKYFLFVWVDIGVENLKFYKVCLYEEML